MAMAEVYYPDVVSAPMDDPSSVSLPRAPPPSPEMQPRGSGGNKFEFPANKWEGIGLDLTRNSFVFDEETEGGEIVEDCYHPEQRKPHEKQAQRSGSLDEEDESYYAYSPRKRVCCAGNSRLSEGYAHTVTAAASSSYATSSLASSGFGSFHDNFSQGGVGVGVAVVGGNGGVIGLDAGVLNGTLDPALPTVDLSARHHHPRMQSKPHLIPPRPDVMEGGAVLMRDPFSPSYLLSNNEDFGEQRNAFSHSFDLHTTHPHLPHSFETTQLPKVRPGRSRTLDVTSLQKTLIPPPESLSGTDLDGSQRKRKVSIKRKNPEEIENDSLQFSFDYSYSSTGSMGESDWVLVDQQIEGVCPMEKKPCGEHHSTKLLHPFLFNGNSLVGTLRKNHQIDASQGIVMSSSFSPFLNDSIEHGLKEEGPVGSSPAHEQIQAASSMGLDRKEDCFEEAETMEMEVEPSSNMSSDNIIQSSNIQHTCPANSQLLLRPHPPASQAAVSSGDSPGLLSIPSRHSCMEGFLFQNNRVGGLWCSDKSGECIQMDSETETKVSMSKSL